MPYYNYTIAEVINGTEVELTNYDKFLPRTWLNSNRTIVKSFAQMPVEFEDAHALTKVYVVRNLGVLPSHNDQPEFYSGSQPIWNLNLPLFRQKQGWEINVF